MADFSGIALPADVTDLLAEDLGEADTTFPDLLLAYQNELASPELLPAHDLTVLQMCIKNQVLALSSPPTGPIAALRRTMMLAELDRVKYIVADYLRTRVRKIESNVAFYRKKYPQGMCRTTNRMFMTQPETAFCGKFFDLLKSQQHEMVLKHHHKMFQGFEEDEMIVEPEAGTYVFGRIRKDKEAADDEEEEEDLLEGQLDSASVGDMLLVRYDKIIEKVIRGEIELIV